MDERSVLVDARTGLHVAWYFWLRVLDEANRASRYGVPFGLLLLQARFDPVLPQRVLTKAASRIPQLIRLTDLGGLIGTGAVGILLPHQDGTSAESGTARIMAQLEKSGASRLRWDSRLLRYPEDGAEISRLITHGWTPDEIRSLAS